jgi:probable rRNA maturation factor
MPVYVATRGLSSSPIKPNRVRLAGERMLEAIGREDAELSIMLCDDETIHELNRDYRKKDRPTDVLSFAMQEGEGGDLHPGLLGDVVISVDTARRQAADRGWTIAAEIRFLLAHGLLHLLGHDHRTRDEERRMLAMGDALIAAAIRRNDPEAPPERRSNRPRR